MEEVVFRGRPSIRNYLAEVVLGAMIAIGSQIFLLAPDARVIALVGLGLGLLMLLGAYAKTLLRQYVVTTERVKQRVGLLSRRLSEIEIGDIRNVQIRQRFVQRLLSVGDVFVSTAGQSNLEIEILGVRNPQWVADLIRHQRHRVTSPEIGEAAPR